MIEINKIYNEDCLETMARMDDGSVDVVITSPPYNKKKNHRNIHKSDSWVGGASYIDYGEHNDDMDEGEYQSWQIKILSEAYRILKDRGSFFYNHKNRTVKGEMISPIYWLSKSPLKIKQEIIWRAVNLVEIDRVKFFPYTERIYWLTKTTKPKFIGEYANYGDVWDITPARGDERYGHPAPFPIDIPIRCINACSNEDDVIYDPFMGSGTTAVACVKGNRRFIGSEISKSYCDIANKRIQQELSQLKLPI